MNAEPTMATKAPHRRNLRWYFVPVLVGLLVACVPVRCCPRCDGAGTLPIEFREQRRECWSCDGSGRHTLPDVLWPVWGS